MPYNNTPITPSKEITGTVALPLARVKKIIATDDDIAQCSNNAAFVITVATEMFLQHLVEQSYNIVKSERKPRRNIQYRDVANAVARVENLEFLTDVVPKTTTYKQFKQKMAKENAAQPSNGSLANGQGTLDGHMAGGATKARRESGEEQQATNGASVHQDVMEVDDDDDDTEEVVDQEAEEDKDGTTSPPEPAARAAVRHDEEDEDDEME